MKISRKPESKGQRDKDGKHQDLQFKISTSSSESSGNNNSRKCWHISLAVSSNAYGNTSQQLWSLTSAICFSYIPSICSVCGLACPTHCGCFVALPRCSSQLVSMPDFADLLTSCSENSTYWRESCAEYDVVNHQGKEIGFLQKKVVSVLQLLHRKTEHVVPVRNPLRWPVVLTTEIRLGWADQNCVRLSMATCFEHLMPETSPKMTGGATLHPSPGFVFSWGFLGA